MIGTSFCNICMELVNKFSSVPRPAMKVLGFIVAFAVAALIKIALSKLF